MPKTSLGQHETLAGCDRSVPYDWEKIAARGIVVGVWIAWTLLDLGYITWYGVDIPFLDEWDSTVPYLTGEAPCDWKSLWASHNEHRLVIPKVAGLGLLWIGGGDFRTVMYANAALLSAACGIILWQLRQRRGRVAWTDVVVPLVLLPWIHAENLLWAFQLAFVLNAVLPCVMIASLIALAPDRPERALLVFGACALALPLTGAAGTVVSLVSAPALWLPARDAWNAGRRKRSLGWVVLSLAIWGVCAAAYVPSQGQSLRLPWFEVAIHTGTVMTTILGDIPVDARPWAGVACLVVVGLAAGRLVAVAWQRPAERLRCLSLLAVLLGLVAVCAAIGYARVGLAGILAKRYATLVAPIVVLIYVVAEHDLGGRARRIATWSLVFVFAALQWNYIRGGLDVARFQLLERGRVRSALIAGLDADLVVASNGMSLHPDPETLRKGLRGLAKARVGYFETIRIGDTPQ